MFFSKPFILTAIICVTSQSQGALILDFNQVGNDVVMTTSGVVDVRNSFTQDFSDIGISTGVDADGLFNKMTASYDYFTGVDLLGSAFSTSSTPVLGSTSTGGYFWVRNETLFVAGNNDDNADTLTPNVNVSITWDNATFASLGIDHHTKDTAIGLWQNSSLAGVGGQVQFRVNSVPEPSGVILFGSSLLGGLFIRKRK